MGVDTHGRLLGYVRPEEVLNFVRQKFDENAKSEVKKQNYGKWKGTDQEYIAETGFISLTYKGELRQIFYCYNNINFKENLEYYTERGLRDMVETETTFISLGCWGSSVEIIKALVEEFGGWIDENDCDDVEYYPILKNSDGSIKPVFHVTMEDIYDKFGGVVIIDKTR